MPKSQWDGVLGVNPTGVAFLCCRAFSHGMTPKEAENLQPLSLKGWRAWRGGSITPHQRRGSSD